ncbi:hypothetical protein QTP88_022504 [Uroleucon formosanum]
MLICIQPIFIELLMTFFIGIKKLHPVFILFLSIHPYLHTVECVFDLNFISLHTYYYVLSLILYTLITVVVHASYHLLTYPCPHNPFR